MSFSHRKHDSWKLLSPDKVIHFPQNTYPEEAAGWYVGINACLGINASFEAILKQEKTWFGPFWIWRGETGGSPAVIKLIKQNTYSNNSPVRRTEEQNDKEMTRNFDADCKIFFNIYCPMGNNILQVACPGQYHVLLSTCLYFNLLFLVALSNIIKS